MKEDIRNEIVRQRHAGASIRAIARSLQLSRRTVGRILTRVSAERAGQVPARPRRPRLLDPFEGVIQELLERYPQMTAVRIHEELRQRGFAVLHVKTLAPSHPDPFYARTRAFYRALGFEPVFETPLLWGPENPALVSVKLLG